VALLTAAAHSGGKPLGLELAAQGYDIVVSTEALLRGRAAAIRATGRQADAFRNVTYDDAELDALVDACERLGPITLIVHVAPVHVPAERIAAAVRRRGHSPAVRRCDGTSDA
jgi:hypothetical protein